MTINNLPSSEPKEFPKNQVSGKLQTNKVSSIFCCCCHGPKDNDELDLIERNSYLERRSVSVKNQSIEEIGSISDGDSFHTACASIVSDNSSVYFDANDDFPNTPEEIIEDLGQSSAEPLKEQIITDEETNFENVVLDPIETINFSEKQLEACFVYNLGDELSTALMDILKGHVDSFIIEPDGKFNINFFEAFELEVESGIKLGIPKIMEGTISPNNIKLNKKSEIIGKKTIGIGVFSKSLPEKYMSFQ